MKLLRIEELAPLLRARGVKPAGTSKGELVAAAVAAGIAYRDLDGGSAARLLEKLGHPVSDGELTAMDLNRFTVVMLSQLCERLGVPPLRADARKSDFVIALLGAHVRHSALNLEQRAALASSSGGAGAPASPAAAGGAGSVRSPAATATASPAAASRPSPATGAAAAAACVASPAAAALSMPSSGALAASSTRLLAADNLHLLTVVALRQIAKDRLGIKLLATAVKADVVTALIAGGVREGHLTADELAVIHAKSAARAARTPSPAATAGAASSGGSADGSRRAAHVGSLASPAVASTRAGASTSPAATSAAASSASATSPATSGGIAAAVSAAIDAVFAATIGGGRKSPAARVGAAYDGADADDVVAAAVGIRSGGDGTGLPARLSPTPGLDVLRDDASDSDDDVGVVANLVRFAAEKKLSRHADSVWRYRRNVDLYSGRTRADIEAEAAAAAAASGEAPTVAAIAAAAAAVDPPSPASKAKRHYSPTDVDHVWECQVSRAGGAHWAHDEVVLALAICLMRSPHCLRSCSWLRMRSLRRTASPACIGTPGFTAPCRRSSTA